MGRDDILEKQNVHVLVWIKLDYAHEVYCFLPTNHTNFRASECKTELVRVMPSAAENVKEIYTNHCNLSFKGDLFGRTNRTNSMIE